MKSVEIEFHGFKGIRSCVRSLYDLSLGTFVCTQVVHEEMYSYESLYSWPGVFAAYEF